MCVCAHLCYATRSLFDFILCVFLLNACFKAADSIVVAWLSDFQPTPLSSLLAPRSCRLVRISRTPLSSCLLASPPILASSVSLCTHRSLSPLLVSVPASRAVSPILSLVIASSRALFASAPSSSSSPARHHHLPERDPRWSSSSPLLFVFSILLLGYPKPLPLHLSRCVISCTTRVLIEGCGPEPVKQQCRLQQRRQ